MTNIEILFFVSAIITIISVATWSKKQWLRAILFLVLLVAIAWVLKIEFDTDLKEPKRSSSKDPYLISDNQVGGYYVGMPYDLAVDLVTQDSNKIGIFDQGVPETSEVPTVRVKNKNDGEIELIISFINDKAIDILVVSNKYKTQNGVYPGMTLKELGKKYHNLPLFYVEDLYHEELFMPKSPKVSFVVSGGRYAKSPDDFNQIGVYNDRDINYYKKNYSEFNDVFGVDLRSVDGVTYDYDKNEEIIFILVSKS